MAFTYTITKSKQGKRDPKGLKDTDSLLGQLIKKEEGKMAKKESPVERGLNKAQDLANKMDFIQKETASLYDMWREDDYKVTRELLKILAAVAKIKDLLD